MPASVATQEVEKYINSDFRLKFVDEENYIELDKWPEERSAINPVVKRGQGETFRKGEGRSQSLRSLDPKEPAERSEARARREDHKVAEPTRDAAHHAATRRVNLNAMRAGADQIRKKRQEDNKQFKTTTKLRLLRQPIDWAKLDQVGRPVVSFDPFSPERPRMLKVLKRDARDRTRSEIVRKLGVEFSRIYERYRRDAERRRTGMNSMLYEVQGDKERKACEEAAIQCILRSVTPRQVLEYWDKNIKDYTGGNMVIPPLTFLKSASAIDRVAASALGTVSKLEKLKSAPVSKLRPQNRNTFSGTDGLDIRIRPTLERLGFKTQAYNDRYLLSIQHNALSIAAGKSIFLAEGRMRDFVMAIVGELYTGEGADADA